MSGPEPVPEPVGVFVYGTLKRGERRHDMMRAATQVLGATVEGGLYHLTFGYPVVVSEEQGTVHGDLCIFEDLKDVLPVLDDYEDFNPEDPAGSLFLRVKKRVRTEGGRFMAAWVYVAGPVLERRLPEIGTRVESGDWRGGRTG